MKLWKLRRLGQQGVGHYVVPILAFVVLFGVVGSYFVFSSQAATVNTPVKSGYIGMCLNDPGTSSQVNVQVSLASCVKGAASQNWQTGFGDGEIHVYGKCLAVSANSTKPGQPVVVVNCKNSSGALQASVKWTTLRSGALQNVNSNLCLTVPGGSASTNPPSGTKPLTVQNCPASGAVQNQVWSLSWPKGTNTGGTGGSGSGGSSSVPATVEWQGVGSTLKNVSTGTCLTVPGNAAPTASFTALTLSSCSTATGWNLTWGKQAGTSTLVVTTGFSSYCMQTQNNSTTVNSTVGISKCTGSPAQHWKTGYGSGQIETSGSLAGTNYCLGASGTNVVTLSCTTTPAASSGEKTL